MHRDRIHLRAPKNWINDPNGFIWYHGAYHLFYQYFPYEPEWGTMHWGHAVSPDLVEWEHLDIALYPSQQWDRNGCFSGSALEVSGQLYLYYTGVQYQDVDPLDIHRSVGGETASQLMLISRDGYTFDNRRDKRVILPPEENRAGDPLNTRDPKVWRENGMYYMVLGTNEERKYGKLLFYRSTDALQWDYAFSYCRRDETWGWMWECPDLFRLGKREVLLLSAMGIQEDGETVSWPVWTLVRSDMAQECFETADTYGRMDFGCEYYAPQSTVDAEGRRVVIGWLGMPRAFQNADGTLWRGMMSLPRVAECRGDTVCFFPHPNIIKMFSIEVSAGELYFACPFRMQISLPEGGTFELGGCRIYREDGRLCLDRDRALSGVRNGKLILRTDPVPGQCLLDLFVDFPAVEVYVNQGEKVLSCVITEEIGHIAVPDGMAYRLFQTALKEP